MGGAFHPLDPSQQVFRTDASSGRETRFFGLAAAASMVEDLRAAALTASASIPTHPFASLCHME